MNIVQLYNLTILHEALKEGQKVRVSDINFVYGTLPGAPTLKSKAGKIKYINEIFEAIATEALAAYLIQLQIKKQQENPNGE